MVNRLKEIRQRRGLTQAELADRVGTTGNTISRLEIEQRQLSSKWLRLLSRALDVEPEELVASTSLRTVPMTEVVAASSSDVATPGVAHFLPRIHVPPMIEDPDTCFAVRVGDDSGNRLYPRHSILIARALAALDRPLSVGQKVIIRHYATDKATGDATEVLVGLLDRNAGGDIVLGTESTNREVPAAIMIRRSAPRERGRHNGFAEERMHRWHVPDAASEIDYEPQPTDESEILGVVILAMTPE